MKTPSRRLQRFFQQFSFVIIPVFLFILVGGCNNNHQGYFQGYVEGQYLHIASPVGGRLKSLSVTRGVSVAEKTLLFMLDQTIETAGVEEAKQNLQRAENKLANISKGLRPSEIEAIQARLDQAQASYNLAKIEYERRERLLQEKVIAKGALDQTRTEMERSSAAVSQLKAELETAQLGARSDEVKAAQAEVQIARQRLVQAEWKRDQQSQVAPEGGLVFDTYYQPGEYVPPGHPVVSLLPPGNVKIRFFVPEQLVGTLKNGQQVTVQFDGAQKSFTARIAFISPQPEYTPPVIYSRKTRSHLVFMVEAGVDKEEGTLLHPGQPVDVYLEPTDG